MPLSGIHSARARITSGGHDGFLQIASGWRHRIRRLRNLRPRAGVAPRKLGQALINGTWPLPSSSLFGWSEMEFLLDFSLPVGSWPVRLQRPFFGVRDRRKLWTGGITPFYLLPTHADYGPLFPAFWVNVPITYICPAWIWIRPRTD